MDKDALLKALDSVKAMVTEAVDVPALKSRRPKPVATVVEVDAKPEGEGGSENCEECAKGDCPVHVSDEDAAALEAELGKE